MRITIFSLPVFVAIATIGTAASHASHLGDRPRLHSPVQAPAPYRTVKARAETAEAALSEADAQAARASRTVGAARDALRALEADVEKQAAEAANAARRSWMETPETEMLADYGEMVDFYRDTAATLRRDAETLQAEAQFLKQQTQDATSTADDVNEYAQEVSRWAAAWRTDYEWMRQWQSGVEDWSDHADLEVGLQATRPAHMPFGQPDRTDEFSAWFVHFGNSFRNPSWIDELDLPGRFGLTREERRGLLDRVAPAMSEKAMAAEDAVLEAREHLVRRRCGFRDDRSVCSRGGQRWLDALHEAAMAWHGAAEAAARFTTAPMQQTSDSALRAEHASEDAEAAARLARALAEVVDTQSSGSALERARAAAQILTEQLGTSGVIVATAREMERRMEERHGVHLAVAEEHAHDATQRVRAEHQEELRLATAAAQEASAAAAPFIDNARAARTAYQEAAALLETYDTRIAAWSAAQVAAEEWRSARADANRAALVGATLRMGAAAIAGRAASRKLTEAGELMVTAAEKIPRMNQEAVAAAAAALEVWKSRTDAVRQATLRAGGTAAASVVGLASTGDVLLDGFDLGAALAEADMAADALLAALASIS